MFKAAESSGRRRMQIVLIAMACGSLGAIAAGSGEPPLLTQARQALAESVPQIAVFKLRTLLAAGQLPEPERQAAVELLGRAQLASGQADAALQTIKGLTAAGDAETGLLRANILASQGHWAEARRLYRRVAAEFPVAAALGEAEADEALGEKGAPERAAAVLEPLVQRGQGGPLVSIRLAILLCEASQARRAGEILAAVKTETAEEAKWKAYAEGRALLVQDQPAPALEIFEKLLQEREHLPEALLVAATFGKTEARVALNGTEAADDVLEDFIWHNPGSAYLEAAFKRLYQLYEQEDSARESELQGWALRPQLRRAKLALYYVAKLQARQRRFDRAEQSLEWFLRAFRNDPLAREAYLVRGEVYTAEEKFGEAIRSWEAAERLTQGQEERGVIELQRGLAYFRKRDFLEAARRFEEAGRLSGSARAAASFDAALAWLNQGEFDRYHDQDALIFEIEPESPLSGELMLEQGLTQARTGAAGAARSLSGFLQDFPRHARAPEAELALAELALLGGDIEGARAAADQYVRVAEKTPAGEELNAQADWMGIWLADAAHPRDDEQVISLGLSFLREHAESPHRVEVRMKLGEVYSRRGDFANAETQFAELAAADPASAYAEAALFLAGQASTKLIGADAVDQALAFFDRVIHYDGRFKLYARQEQAVIQNRLGHEDQAIDIYDIILRAQPEPDPELRAAALCGKGDNLLSLGRKEWPKTERLEQAVAVFDQLAGDPRVSAHWRNQAGYKKGKAFEQMGRIDDSLAAYYDVLNGEAGGPPEYFWYYKAGFDAAHAFEQQEQWKSAIGIYQKMTKLEGPRTAEAKSRMRQLRLEHFIWD